MDHRTSTSWLLAIAAMPIAGCPADDGETTAASTVATTTGDSGASTSSTGTDGGSSTSSTTATSFPPSDTSTATDTVGDQCAGAPMPLLCEDYGDHFVECFPEALRDEHVHDCVCGVFYAAIYREECGAAAEDYYACVIAAPCDTLMNDPCPTEAMAFLDVCGSHAPPDLG